MQAQVILNCGNTDQDGDRKIPGKQIEFVSRNLPLGSQGGDRMKFGWLLPILVNRIKSVNISIKN